MNVSVDIKSCTRCDNLKQFDEFLKKSAAKARQNDIGKENQTPISQDDLVNICACCRVVVKKSDQKKILARREKKDRELE